LTTNEVIGISSCVNCKTEVQAADRFCGHCGSTLQAERAKPQADVFSLLTPSLTYYFLTLALLATYKLTTVFGDDFQGFVIVNAIDVAIVLVFAIMAWKDIRPLFSFSGFRFSIAALTVVCALAGSLFVSELANFINISINDDVFYDTWLFHETTSPLLYSVLFVCVQPALFEEVAFRGFLLNNIQKIASPAGAIYITSFIFGIVHLAIISMLWLVPIGLAFAVLRLKYNTLWYGVIGHFAYNLGITLLEHFQYTPASLFFSS
jgi:membrane protease YdiL (CAAX protease family)